MRAGVSATLQNQEVVIGNDVHRCVLETLDELSETYPIVLVTLDVNLPGRLGSELLPDLKQRFVETEVLMLTGRGDSQTAIATFAAGACGYLIKPVNPNELTFRSSGV